jgi:hypothetical protein
MSTATTLLPPLVPGGESLEEVDRLDVHGPVSACPRRHRRADQVAVEDMGWPERRWVSLAAVWIS